MRSSVADGNFQVREGEGAVRGRHELLARHEIEQIEHVLVEHLPGADLLLDHVGARLLEIHGAGGL
jgi:hypothetical protein